MLEPAGTLAGRSSLAPVKIPYAWKAWSIHHQFCSIRIKHQPSDKAMGIAAPPRRSEDESWPKQRPIFSPAYSLVSWAPTTPTSNTVSAVIPPSFKPTRTAQCRLPNKMPLGGHTTVFKSGATSERSTRALSEPPQTRQKALCVQSRQECSGKCNPPGIHPEWARGSQLPPAGQQGKSAALWGRMVLFLSSDQCKANYFCYYYSYINSTLELPQFHLPNAYRQD